MWKPMLPTLVDEAPEGDEWIYEIKYDGFRCGIEWTNDTIKLWSRNGHDLTSSFPEIIKWCREQQSTVKEFLPLFLDGELAVLKTPYTAEFSLIQQRGRLKSQEKIKQFSQMRQTTIMVFDLIKLKDKSFLGKAYQERRIKLEELFNHFTNTNRLHLVDTFQSTHDILPIMFLHQSEGIVVKHLNAKYNFGKRTDQWLKVKNYRTIPCVISSWNIENDYFDVNKYENEQFINIGKVKNGFTDGEKDTLKSFFQKNGRKVNGFTWRIPPSVCIDLNCLGVGDGDLREPSFHQFRFDLEPEDCTTEQIQIGLAQMPEEIEISKPDKKLFPDISKRDYVLYLRNVAPFLLPRLQDKRLTMIRYPDGISEHSFYQKHLPDYAPDFIQTVKGDDEDDDILCQDLRSLLWFGNHAALEFHVPFHTIHSTYPDEMVFDLDPPSLKQFPLAVQAAHLIKEMIDSRGFQSFVKTSGRTGLQIHIPLEPRSMTFDDTRQFMEAVAQVLVEKYPKQYTIERLKKNRGKRLYIDYIQHAPGKTIVAPYSPRATKEATVATPLFWYEVNDQLDPRNFTIKNIPRRLSKVGCPMNQCIDSAIKEKL